MMGKMTKTELKKYDKKKIIPLAFLALVLTLSLVFYQSFLRMAGEYMAPANLKEAEAVVIESSELVREKAVKMGMELISQNKARLLVVVYQNSLEEKVFGRPNDYGDFLAAKLESWNLKNEQILIIKVPKDHPITLIEAQIVLKYLAEKGIKKVILLAESFHTRRSFWAYKKVGDDLDMKIYPLPYFLKYHRENWWQHNQGIREFCTESVKFLYYLIRGYIPIKSIFLL
jgi:uncharacterized SAM-binding protein YcdF (DUF218 family)